MPIINNITNAFKNKPTALPEDRRADRPWFDTIDNDVQNLKGVYKPRSSTPSINPVYQRDISTPYINPVDQRDSSTPSINGIIQKGCINPVNEGGYLRLKYIRLNPLKLLEFLYNLIKENDPELTTKQITFTEIQNRLNWTRNQARGAIRFLLYNNIIERSAYQVGKNGWSKYSINDDILDELRQSEQKGYINPVQISSSSNIIKTTTTEVDHEKVDQKHRSDHKNYASDIDIEPLEKIGFTMSHVEQFISIKDFPFEKLQDSIYHFAFALEHKTVKVKETAIGLFMSTMKRDKVFPPPVGYEHPSVRANRIFDEAKRAEFEANEKRKKEMEIIEFTAWYDALTEQEKDEIMPSRKDKFVATLAIKSHFKKYFSEYIYGR